MFSNHQIVIIIIIRQASKIRSSFQPITMLICNRIRRHRLIWCSHNSIIIVLSSSSRLLHRMLLHQSLLKLRLCLKHNNSSSSNKLSWFGIRMEGSNSSFWRAQQPSSRTTKLSQLLDNRMVFKWTKPAPQTHKTKTKTIPTKTFTQLYMLIIKQLQIILLNNRHQIWFSLQTQTSPIKIRWSILQIRKTMPMSSKSWIRSIIKVSSSSSNSWFLSRSFLLPLSSSSSRAIISNRHNSSSSSSSSKRTPPPATISSLKKTFRTFCSTMR